MAGMNWRGPEAEALIRKVAMAALRDGAEHILTKAIDDTPIDTGTLRRSGTVTVGALPDSAAVFAKAETGTEMKDAHLEAKGTEKAVYASFNTPYALRQHEDLALRHSDGGPKFLENAYKDNVGKIKQLVDVRVKKALKEAP